MDKEPIYTGMETTRQEHLEKKVDRGTFKAITADDGTMTFEIYGKWLGVSFLTTCAGSPLP